MKNNFYLLILFLHTFVDMSLQVKPSTIPDSGKGLFTKTAIKKGEIVIEYTGEIVTWKTCQKRNEEQEGFGGYYFFISEKRCIDAQYDLKALARYANDAAGFSRIPGIRNNCRYEVIKNKAYIVASRNIKPGEEIFVAYGRDYWNALKKNGLGPKVNNK